MTNTHTHTLSTLNTALLLTQRSHQRAVLTDTCASLIASAAGIWVYQHRNLHSFAGNQPAVSLEAINMP